MACTYGPGSGTGETIELAVTLDDRHRPIRSDYDFRLNPFEKFRGMPATCTIPGEPVRDAVGVPADLYQFIAICGETRQDQTDEDDTKWRLMVGARERLDAEPLP